MNIRLIFFLILFIAPVLLFGQPGVEDDPGVPITGIEILLALGGIVGIKRIMGNKKTKNP